MRDMGFDIEKGKAYRPAEGFIPNPKLRLLDQVSEVKRFKHYSIPAYRKGDTSGTNASPPPITKSSSNSNRLLVIDFVLIRTIVWFVCLPR